MIAKPLVIVLFLLSFFGSNAQKQELGKVTIDELKEKACPSDTSAAAAILFSIGKSYFRFSESKGGFEIVTEKIAKIKIYKKEGYDLANQEMRFYVGGSNDERADVSKAATYNLVNGKIEKTKLSSEGEFNEKVNKYWSKKKIALPNVKVGSIIEFKFEVVSSYITIEPWQFQTDVPVKYSEFTTSIPEYYIFNTQSKGFLSPKTESEINSRMVTYTTKERIGTRLVKTIYDTDSFSYMETRTKYVLENIPALKEENFVNNIDNYRSAILHELASIRPPNGPFENFSTNWETVVKKVYENDEFGSELNKTGYFEKDIDVLLNGVTAQNERIFTIFDYAKSRMNWNEYYGYHCDAGVRKAYNDKTGNVAEINLMLTAMLRYAGIQANPVILSTRSNGIAIFPSNTAYNYVIAGVELDGQTVLLDATEKYALPNILPIRDLNWFGRIIRKNGTSEIIDLMPNSNSKDIVNIMATINDKGEVTGKVRDQYFDYNAYVFRNANNSASRDSYVEKFEKKHQGLEVGEYEVQNSKDLGKPLIENYSFTTTSSVEQIGDKMYVSPFLFYAKTENPFKQEVREYPIDFVFPSQTKFNISLIIPEGYVAELLPAPKLVAMPDNLSSFKYNITNNGNQIQALYTFDINRAIIGAEYYQELKAFYKEIVDKQTEKIVLKKV